MTTLSSLQKIIPPDQALANKALSRALQQVKNISEVNINDFSVAVSQLESNKDLSLINSLTTPLPTEVSNFINSSIATGTGPGNTITINDVIGTAAGVTHTTELPIVTNILEDLDADGELDVLTADNGPSSASTGVYTVMQYCLAGTYTSGMGPYTVTIPGGVYGAGSYSGATVAEAIDSAFASGLIPAAANVIAAVAAANSELAQQSNAANDAMAEQLVLNINNSISAGIDIGNVVNDIANANLIANSTSAVLGLASNLHDIGLDITEGGSAQFFEATAQTNNLAGQAVIASMREGRNIAVLNSVGIILDTQITDVTADPVLANNLSDGQYTTSEAAQFAQNNQ